MTRTWETIGEDWMAIENEEQLMRFLSIGGNALIAEDLAKDEYADHVAPHEVTRAGPLGFIRFDPGARAVTRSRPRPWLRNRVLQRDNYTCQICGVHDDRARLELHHVRNFGRGGLTVEENLLTLCSPCHGSLNPHEDLDLFYLPGGLKDRYVSATRRREAFRRYQAWANKALQRIPPLHEA